MAEKKEYKKFEPQRLSEEVWGEVERACKVLKRGGLILYPTDTIWGIGCDATNEKAVQRIYELKRREESKSMLVLLDNPRKLPLYATIPSVAYDLVKCATTPVTIIYPKAANLAPNLISEDGSIGIRITNEPFSKALVKHFGKPIVSTSANISGNPAPATFSEISGEIRKGVDYVVEYRQNEKGGKKPSSIIKFGVGGEFEIIR